MRLALITTSLLAATFAQAADLNVSVLDRNGKPLPEAVVLVDSSVQGSRPAPVLEAHVTQEYLKFVPAVTVVSPGAKVTFSNRDGWDHHIILGLMGAGGVYLDPGQNTQLRLAGRTGVRTASETRTLPQPGAYLLGCHIHGSMRGHILVADSPWAKLTSSEGKALVQGLPEGPVKVRIWHADQLVEGAAVSAQVAATGNALVVNTQIAPQRRRAAQNFDHY